MKNTPKVSVASIIAMRKAVEEMGESFRRASIVMRRASPILRRSSEVLRIYRNATSARIHRGRINKRSY